MSKTKKPTGYYIAGGIFILAVFVNVFSKDGNNWVAAFWAGLAILMFLLASKKNKKNKVEQAKEAKELSEVKNAYMTMLNEGKSENPDVAEFDKVSNEMKQNAIKSIMDDIIYQETSGGTLSPEGYNKIIESGKSLHIKMQIDSKTQEMLAKLRTYWSIENESLTEVVPGISLQKDETYYYKSTCQWMEHRTTTKSVTYSGLTASFKITKGLRYRIGNFKPQRITTDALTEIDRGEVFITNKRIIFMGGKKNANIKYSSVLSIVPYSDGVGIEKDSGKSPILICPKPDIIARILAKMLNN